MNDKFIKKYMRLAKFYAEDQISCLSRGIGCVIVDPTTPKMRLVSTGYNGPVRGAPRSDSYKYLMDVVWPQLTEADKDFIKNNNTIPFKWTTADEEEKRNLIVKSDVFFASYFDQCQICPRRLIGAKSGERMSICFQCAHAERNAIHNAVEDLNGFYMFCWCGVPCNDCAVSIVQSGLSRVYCLEDKSQSIKGNNGYGLDRSRWLFANSKPRVELIELDRDWINK